MNHPKARHLIKKYLSNRSSEHESALIETWYVQTTQKTDAPTTPIDYDVVGQEILNRLRNTQQKPIMTKLWFTRIAAALLLLVGAAVMLVYWNRADKQPQLSYGHDFMPGRHAATLTLANGKRIALDDLGTSEALNEAGVSLSKTKDGELVYQASDINDKGSNVENTLYTANGQNFRVILQDGTVVWLNSGSSISYPVSFKNAKKRKVRLSGEAYFEVKHQPDAPFSVLTNKEEISVLGTHFNVRSYPDQTLRQTTLLEGKVEVAELGKPGTKKVMKPGQQISFDETGTTLLDVDAEEAIAWKEGLFYFHEQKLELIMQDISKWYNVKIIFRDANLSKVRYSGSLSKYTKVSQVLRKIEQMGGVKFNTSSTQIIVEKTNN